MRSSRSLPDARTAVEVVSERLGELLHSQPTAQVPIEGSLWTVRDAAAHLVCTTTLYSELAAGAVSPITEFTPQAAAEFNAHRIADIALSEPAALAKSLAAATDGFVEITSRRSGSTAIRYHGDLTLDLGQLTGFLLGEYLLHGYDIALATEAPWPIDPSYAALALHAYAPAYPRVTEPATVDGHSATYLVRLGLAGAVAMRFTDGALQIELATDIVDDDRFDCVITADPVAYLLVSSGRLSQWTAIALGLISASGRRPELASSFGALFRRF